MSLRLPDELKDRLVEVCRVEERRVSDVVRRLIRGYVGEGAAPVKRAVPSGDYEYTITEDGDWDE